MSHWQVQAEMPGGGQMMFGIQAEDKTAALAGAVLVLGDAGAAGEVSMQITEIPPRAERGKPS